MGIGKRSSLPNDETNIIVSRVIVLLEKWLRRLWSSRKAIPSILRCCDNGGRSSRPIYIQMQQPIDEEFDVED